MEEAEVASGGPEEDRVLEGTAPVCTGQRAHEGQEQPPPNLHSAGPWGPAGTTCPPVVTGAWGSQGRG